DALGAIAFRTGEHERAAALILEALAHATDSPLIALMALFDLAGVLAFTGASLRTARLLGAAQAAKRNAGIDFEPLPRGVHEREVLEELVRTMNPAELEATLEEGRRLTLEQAIAEALAPDVPAARSPAALP